MRFSEGLALWSPVLPLKNPTKISLTFSLVALYTYRSIQGPMRVGTYIGVHIGVYALGLYNST